QDLEPYPRLIVASARFDVLGLDRDISTHDEDPHARLVAVGSYRLRAAGVVGDLDGAAGGGGGDRAGIAEVAAAAVDVDAAGGGAGDRAAVDGDDAGAERVEQDPIRGTVGGHARERVDTGGVVEGERGAGGGRDRALLLRVERGTGRDPLPHPTDARVPSGARRLGDPEAGPFRTQN